jgi:hypothetical protein
MTLENNHTGLVPLVQQAIDFNSYNILYANSALESLKNNLTITQDTLVCYKPLLTNAAFYGSCVASFAATNFATNLAYSALFVPTAVTAIVPSAVVVGVGVSYLAINSYISYQVGLKAAQKTESFMDNVCSIINSSLAIDEEIDYEVTLEEDYWEEMDKLYDGESWGVVNIVKSLFTTNTDNESEEDAESLFSEDETSSVDSDDFYSVCDYEELMEIQQEDLSSEPQSYVGGFLNTLMTLL